MNKDPKRELLRHMVATVWFRGRIATSDAPEIFAQFQLNEETRSSVEILAHIGDLLAGSHHLLRGEYVEFTSEPLDWDKEIGRFFGAVKALDEFLASDTPLAHPIEKFVQGPIGDALTHVGQIVMLRRAAGCPIKEESYFSAEIEPGRY